MLTTDKTPISWQGVSGITLLYLVCKSHCLDFEVITLVCSISKIVLEINLIERVEKDAGKLYNKE